MGLLKEIYSFSKGLITDPEERFRALADGGTKAAVPAGIYLLAVLLGALFMKIRPADFPAEFARLALPERGWLYYFSADLLLGALFTAVSSALLLFFLRFFSGGKLFFRALLCAAALGALAGAALAAQSPAVFLAAAAGLGLFAAWTARAEIKTWPRFFLGSLALNLAAVLVFPADLAAVLLRSENLFIGAEAAAGLWALLLAVKLARAFTGASVPKAALALAASFAATLFFFSALYGAGLISKELYGLLFIL